MDEVLKGPLRSLKEISQYSGFGKEKVVRMATEGNFPASKIEGAWRSHTDLIDRWYMENIVTQ